jgi:hypothetical protein
MAAIDKIYGDVHDWVKLKHFLIEKGRYDMIEDMYPRPKDSYKEAPLSNFKATDDKWLFEHCELEFVRKRLKEQHPGWFDEN